MFVVSTWLRDIDNTVL